MKKTLITILGLIFYSSIIAQTQGEMNESESAKYTKADKELNEVYNQILIDYKENTEFITKLRFAQLQWIKFRDAEIEMKFPEPDKQASYGTMYPMCRLDYLTLLTKERTKKLKEWLRPRPDGEGCGGSIKERDIDKSQIIIEKIDEYQFTSFINEFEMVKEFKTADLSVRIIKLQNSAILASLHGEEVTDNLYIAISDLKEYPSQILFLIGEFNNPIIDNTDTSKSKEPKLNLSYGNIKDRKKIELILTIDGIKKASR
jgi:uncharacterized protein YecT (DUF1311 family)